MSEIKEYLDKLNECWRLFDKAAKPLCDKLYKSIDNARLVETKPTLSEILTKGSKRIDDAVEAVIARHEKEIAYDELVQEETKRAIDQVGRSQYDIRATHTASKTWLLQQMGSDRRNLMNQFQGGNWI